MQYTGQGVYNVNAVHNVHIAHIAHIAGIAYNVYIAMCIMCTSVCLCVCVFAYCLAPRYIWFAYGSVIFDDLALGFVFCWRVGMGSGIVQGSWRKCWGVFLSMDRPRPPV